MVVFIYKLEQKLPTCDYMKLICNPEKNRGVISLMHCNRNVSCIVKKRQITQQKHYSITLHK